MAGEATYTPTQADYIAANRLWTRRARSAQWVRWLGLAGLALALANTATRLSFGTGGVDALLDSTVMLVFGGFCVASPLLTIILLPRSVRKMFKQRPSMAEPITASWDEERFSFSNASGYNNQPWSTLHRWIRDEQSIVLLPTDRMMMVVPVRALSRDQMNDLVRLLQLRRPEG